MWKNNKGAFIVAFALLFAACSVRPSYVLSEKKMENILYDLYLADAAKSDNYMIFNSDSVRNKELSNSVFGRHKVTAHDFDTSLLWYAANLDRYERIMDRVVVRYSADAEKLVKAMNEAAAKKIGGNRNNLIDTAYFVLHTPGLFQNRYVFNLRNPISLPKEKNFSISFETLGVSDVKPELFVHIYSRDTTLSYQETINRDGTFSKSYKMPDDMHPNRIYGYIEIPDTVPAFILFRHFAVSADSTQLSVNSKQLSVIGKQ